MHLRSRRTGSLRFNDIIEVMEAFLERERPPAHIRPELDVGYSSINRIQRPNQLSSDMKDAIRLDIVHSEKARVEHFLNSVDEDLEQIPFTGQELSGVDDIIAGFKFSVKGRSSFVIVIFAASYSYANKIEAANLVTRPNKSLEALAVGWASRLTS